MTEIKKTLGRLLSIVSLSCFLALSGVNIATACMEAHEPGTLSDMYNSDVVFLGKVMEVKSDWTPAGKPEHETSGILVTYEILRHYKGVWPWQEHIEIITSDFRNLGLFEVGEEGLVVAGFSKEDDHYRMRGAHISGRSSCGVMGYYQNENAMRAAEFNHEATRQIRVWAFATALFIALFLALPLWTRRKANLAKTVPPSENNSDEDSGAQ